MKRPYAVARTQANRDIHLAAPRVRRYALILGRLIAGPYLRFGLGCRRVNTVRIELPTPATCGRRTVRPFRELIVPGAAIDLSGRVHEYRGAKKATVAQVMAELEREYLRCISDARHVE